MKDFEYLKLVDARIIFDLWYFGDSRRLIRPFGHPDVEADVYKLAKVKAEKSRYAKAKLVIKRITDYITMNSNKTSIINMELADRDLAFSESFMHLFASSQKPNVSYITLA